MKRNSTIKYAIQIAALLAMSGIAIIALFWVPMDVSGWWWGKLLLSKVVAGVMFIASGHYYEKWKQTNQWLNAYDRNCDEVLNVPNPMQTNTKRIDKYGKNS